MKALFVLALVIIFHVSSLAADGFSSVTINGTKYTDITKVYINPAGKVIIIFSGGGTSAKASDLPTDFLHSWGIDKSSQEANELDVAIKTGSFRKVNGVVYDIRKSESGWIKISNAKIIQILDNNDALVNLSPNDYSAYVVHVKNIPNSIGDKDWVNFSAKLVGNYQYVNKLHDDRTVREYDLGKICLREEIPDSVLSGKNAYDFVVLGDTPDRDIIATLPESEDLKISGSGFFISEDGYLITNFHVVKSARKVKIKLDTNTYVAEVIRFDKTNDLALLKVNGHFQPLPIATQNVELGKSVFTIGFPNIELQGTDPKYTDGKISSLSGLKDDPTRFQISVPVQPGNSGGPLVSSDGYIVGVIVSKLDDMTMLLSSGALPQNVNYAVKGDCLSRFLSLSPEVNLTKTAPSPSLVIQSTQKSVALVLVY